MAYTLADIRSRVLTDKLQDTSYDIAPINNFINDTQRQIFNTYELGFQEKIFTGNLPGGGYQYTFPADYQQAQSLVMTDPTTGYILDITDNYIDFRTFNAQYPYPQGSVGRPYVWTIYAGKILFNCQTDTNYVLSLFYLKTPATLTSDTQNPEIPEEFNEVLVLGAYYRALDRNEDFDQASYIKSNEYEPMLDLMVARLGKKQTGKAITMRQPNRAGYRRNSSRS